MFYPGYIDNCRCIIETNEMGVIGFPFSVIYI